MKDLSKTWVLFENHLKTSDPKKETSRNQILIAIHTQTYKTAKQKLTKEPQIINNAHQNQNFF